MGVLAHLVDVGYYASTLNPQKRPNASKRLMTRNDRNDDADLQPIPLVESKVAIDLLERYRERAGIGSIELEKHIALEAAKIAGVRGVLVSKSMLDSWRAGRSAPGATHMPSLKVFFQSKRYRRLVPEAEYLWSPLESTVNLGVQLMQWHGFSNNGKTSDIDGVWFDYDNIDPAKRHHFEAKRPEQFFRISSVPGYGFGVIHMCSAWIEGRIENAVVLQVLQSWSGFVFCDDKGYVVIERSRMCRRTTMKFTLRRHFVAGLPDTLLWVDLIDPPSLPAARSKLPRDDPQYRPPGFALSRNNQVLPEAIRKMFDSFQWSVLPHDIRN